MDNSIEEVPWPKPKKEPKKRKEKEAQPVAEKEPVPKKEPAKATEEEAYLSDYDEDWQFTDPNMAVLRFQSRNMPNPLAYTAVNRSKGTAAVALANAIDDNLWFPTTSK